MSSCPKPLQLAVDLLTLFVWEYLDPCLLQEPLRPLLCSSSGVYLRLVLPSSLSAEEERTLTALGFRGAEERYVRRQSILSMSANIEEEKKAYAEFENKVKRTILLDNLAPEVTAQIVKSSLAQCGNVLSVQFIPNYTIPQDIPQAALVEMETPKQAESLVAQMSNCPFMMACQPRPVSAHLAKIANFADRPRRPDKKISLQWVNPGDPDYEVAKKLQNLAKKHAVESAALLKWLLSNFLGWKRFLGGGLTILRELKPPEQIYWKGGDRSNMERELREHENQHKALG